MYFPRVGEIVRTKKQQGLFIVIRASYKTDTADLRNPLEEMLLDVPFKALMHPLMPDRPKNRKTN